MIARSPHAALVAALTCGLVTSACSIVVAPENFPIECQLDPALPDPCPPEYRCNGLLCEKTPEGCVPTAEDCDGRDNNCNGYVDEGHDADGDGFTFCGSRPGAMPGTFDAAPTNAGFSDCDESNPDVHPGAIDLCDGRVNACPAVGTADDGADCGGELACVDARCVDPTDCTAFPALCTGGQRCDPGSLSCVTTACVPADCPGQRCGPTSECVDLSPLGADCNVDQECAPGTVCMLRDAFGLATGTARGICGKACCDGDGECGTGEECVQAASGARTCLPSGRASALGIPTPVTRTCQSFFASGYLACLGELTSGCRDASETPQPVCRFYQYGSCGLPGDEPTIFGCGLPCDSGSDCSAGERCEFIAAGNTWLGRCNPNGGAAAGASCGSNDACRDGVCVAGTCGTPCCTDADCGSAHCRPYMAGGGLVAMRCQ